MATESEVRDTLARSPGFTGLDRVTFADNAAATRAFEQLNQILSTRFGKRSPFAERAVTWADLQRYGFATLKTPSGSILAPGGGTPFPDPIPVPSDPTLDPSIPSAPSGLAVTGAVVTMILEWDDPAFSYFGYTEVWRASTNNLAVAVKIGQTNAALYADAIGQESTTYYYWIRHVSKAGNPGPYNASGGTSAVTSAGGAAAIADGSITGAKLANLAVSTAKIADGAIVNAKIGTAAIKNANIADAEIQSAKIVSLSAGKLTASALAVDQYIQSFAYNPGVAGWRIHANGSAEFSSVTVRGLFEAHVPGYPTVQFGNYVGPGGAHFGLSLSSSDFNNIFLRRSDGVVFFRVNDGGASSLTYNSLENVVRIKGTLESSDISTSIVRNADSSSYLDMRSGTPSGYLLNTPNAKILANGSTRFSNAVAEGYFAIPFEQQFFVNGETREFFIPTAAFYSHAADATFGSWSAAVEVTCTATLGLTTAGNAVVAFFDNDAAVSFRSLILSNGSGTGTLPSTGGQVFVRVQCRAQINGGPGFSPSLADLRAQGIYWRVFRVT
jgi:hypothetical protein